MKRNRNVVVQLNISLLLMTIVTLSSCSTKSKNSLDQENSEGSAMSSVTFITHQAIEKSGKTEKGNLLDKSIVRYDEKGNEIEEISYDQDDVFRKSYEYDDDGNLKEWSWSDRDKQLMSRSTFNNDNNGNRVEMTNYDQNGNSLAMYTYEYDTNGNQVNQTKYDEDEGKTNISKFTYEYDTNGNRILENWNWGFLLNGTFVTLTSAITKYTFDDNGNEIERSHYTEADSATIITTFKYENYDQHGNWVKRISFVDDKPNVIRERVIEYF